MVEGFDLQAAIKDAIQTEKDAMDFYALGAKQLQETKAREVFELLAREERQHAFSFFSIYRGKEIPSFEAFIDGPPNADSTWFHSLQRMMLADFDERKALELALEQEEALEQSLRTMAARIDDPQVASIYLANATSTHNHAELIEEQYRAMLGMAG
jgi:rubrerythrin